jgi:biotin carboxylase
MPAAIFRKETRGHFTPQACPRIPSPNSAFYTGIDQALSAAEQIGYPVALKAQSALATRATRAAWC